VVGIWQIRNGARQIYSELTVSGLSCLALKFVTD
jgi:hypothetical protein